MPDLLDRQILHALQINGRVPFNRLAAVIGVSDQTVARRYRQMRSAGLLRVRGLLEPAKVGRTQWIVRIRCAPSATTEVAERLARRHDTSWISLTIGVTEIVCVLNVRSKTEHPVPLLEKLILSRDVIAVDAQCVLHEFFGGTASLINKHGPLDISQAKALEPVEGSGPVTISRLEGHDDALLQALESDGRATLSVLAAASGRSQSSVRRRIAELLDARVLYFDVDFDQSMLGLGTRTIQWLRVPIEALARTGQALAQHPEVGYIAATTGATNLYCAVSCESPQALYTYLTTRLGPLPDISDLEIVPIARSVKNSSLRAVRPGVLSSINSVGLTPGFRPGQVIAVFSVKKIWKNAFSWGNRSPGPASDR